jgi:hypothetical protein
MGFLDKLLGRDKAKESMPAASTTPAPTQGASDHDHSHDEPGHSHEHDAPQATPPADEAS